MTFFKKNAEHMLQVIHLIATAISSSCYHGDNITSLAIVKAYNKVDSSDYLKLKHMALITRLATGHLQQNNLCPASYFLLLYSESL